MSANRATGSAAPSIKKWVIDSDVEYQLRSGALWRRLQNKSLSHGFIELYWRCHSLTAIRWGKKQPFGEYRSLLRIDLSGLPKLESIPKLKFGGCTHLMSVVFGEHINITNLGVGVFQGCYALTSITLPDKLEIIEKVAFSKCISLERVVCNQNLKTISNNAFQQCSALKSITLPDKLKIIEEGAAFGHCTSLERVVCNKNLKTIYDCAFQYCSKLKDVQLASSSISFGSIPFAACDRIIELADAAGFNSNTFATRPDNGKKVHAGDRVVPYLIARFERSERK